MPMSILTSASLVAALHLGVGAAGQNTFTPGKFTTTVEVERGTSVEVFGYRPNSYRKERMFVVFHGTLRNADEYRDHSIEMAEKYGAIVIAPKFDEKRFPSWRYQRGGVLNRDGSARLRVEWTYAMVPTIINEIRKSEGDAFMPYWLMGHSAGGQFVDRMAALSPFFNRAPGLQRIIAANPGSLIFPTFDWAFSYGYGDLPKQVADQETLKRYLALPLVLYSGSADNKPDEYFDGSPEAMRQGPGRYQRATACFEMGKKIAAERGWSFGWKRMVAEGIDHDHEKMFNHPLMQEALGL